MDEPALPAGGGSCDPATMPFENGAPVVNYCDGAWAKVSQQQTSNSQLFRWTDSEWTAYAPDGRSLNTKLNCYNGDTLRELGAPQALIDSLVMCQEPK